MARKRECIHYILVRLLKEHDIEQNRMIADLEQKFSDVGRKTIWWMYYLKIVLLHDYSNWIIGKREYHWVLDTFSPLLKEPKDRFYFEDVEAEINARHEAGRLYLSKLESADPQKDSNQPRSSIK